MVEEVIEVASVLCRVDHCALFLKLLQAFLCALVDLGSPEKGIEQPAEQKLRFVVKDVGI